MSQIHINIARCIYFAHCWHREVQKNTEKYGKTKKGAEEHNGVQWSTEKYKEVQRSAENSILALDMVSAVLRCAGKIRVEENAFSTGTMKDGQ